MFLLYLANYGAAAATRQRSRPPRAGTGQSCAREVLPSKEGTRGALAAKRHGRREWGRSGGPEDAAGRAELQESKGCEELKHRDGVWGAQRVGIRAGEGVGTGARAWGVPGAGWCLEHPGLGGAVPEPWGLTGRGEHRDQSLSLLPMP